MENPEDYLKFVENPEALGEGEKKLWREIEPIICELLDELKTNEKIETVFVGAKIEHLRNILNNPYRLGINSNWLNHILESSHLQSFLAVSSEFGFDESKFVNLYIQLCVLSCVLHTELFKTFLLWHLKEVNYKVGSFTTTMEKAAPKAWEKLKPYVDNKFRNSLAHETWTVENKQVVLFEDAELNPYEKLDLADFMIRVKKQNVLYICLVNVVVKKIKAKFFT